MSLVRALDGDRRDIAARVRSTPEQLSDDELDFIADYLLGVKRDNRQPKLGERVRRNSAAMQVLLTEWSLGEGRGAREKAIKLVQPRWGYADEGNRRVYFVSRSALYQWTEEFASEPENVALAREFYDLEAKIMQDVEAGTPLPYPMGDEPLPTAGTVILGPKHPRPRSSS